MKLALILGGLCVALAAAASNAYVRLGKSQNALEAVRSAANDNAQNVAKLTEQLKVCIGEESASRERETALALEIESVRQLAQQAQSRERALRDEVYRDDPECQVWGATPVCPAIADRLRSQGDDQD